MAALVEPMRRNATSRLIVRGVAMFAAVLTLPLLYVGGSVTTYHVGLAVPDWPTTFYENMFVYDFWNAPFGVQVEHVHRLYGAAVGMATIVLAGTLLAFEPRRWLRVLGLVALVAVIGQGVLGGLRVTRVSTLLAAVHGGTGQAFFGLLVALCVFASRDWCEAGPRADDSGGLRVHTVIAVLLIYVQIALGSWLRHFATPGALWMHSSVAVVVLCYSAWLAWKVHATPDGARSLRLPAWVLVGSVVAQVGLGLASLVLLWPLDGTARPVPTVQAAVRTLHQTNAAVLFAAAIVLSLRGSRHLAARADAAGLRHAVSPEGRPVPAALDREAFA
jgi:heme a synthase